MFHLRRYFCAKDKTNEILRDPDGLIYLPDDFTRLEFGVPSIELPQTWEFYSNCKSIVILGSPRQGKTTEFEYQRMQVPHGFSLKLRDLSNPNSPDEVIADHNEWLSWLDSDEKGELFIDALDEGKIEAKTIINSLANWIKRLGDHVRERLRVHISCRSAEWARADQDRWFDLFPPVPQDSANESAQSRDSCERCKVLELLDLTRKEISEFCSHERIEPNQFLSKLPRELVPLVARPQTLKFMVEDYRRSPDDFPTSVQELYERVIEKRLQEHNEIYERAGIASTGPESKRFIVEHYALTCTLTAREIIAPEHANLTQSVPGDLSGHGLVEEKEAFKTDIFQTYGHDQYRFNEPELAEYLAAKKLDRLITDNTLYPKKALQLFFPSPENKYPVPLLSRTAVWLCALNQPIRQEFLTIYPSLLIHDYVGDLTDQDKVAIWRWLLEQFRDREWFDDSEWRDHVGVLACESLVPELIEVIENRDRYGHNLRILAIKIARRGRLCKVLKAIAAKIKDYEEGLLFLSVAGRALVELAPPRARELKPWLDLPPDIDPDNELLSQALDALWPQHIDLKILINHLRPHRNYYSVGSYDLFLKDLPKRLTPEERAELVSSLAGELTNRLMDRKKNRDADRHETDRPLFASDFFGEFLSAQLEDWKNRPEHIPLFEEWLDIFEQARRYGLIMPDHDQVKSIGLLIETEHEFRQSLCKQRVLRDYEQKGRHFDPHRFYWTMLEILYPRQEDVRFWQETLKAWQQENEDLVPVAWDSLHMAWKGAGYPDEIIDWIEDLASQSQTIRQLWDRDRQCSLEGENAKWRVEHTSRKKEAKEKRKKNVQAVNKNLSRIRSGDAHSLSWLSKYHCEDTEYRYDPTQNLAKAIQKEFGEKASEAYLEGLHTYWSNTQLPRLSEYYLTNSTPYPYAVILVLQAVDAWSKRKEANWSDLPESLRKKALQAGLSALNNFPDWYTNLASEEEDFTRNLWFETLKLEAESSVDYPRLANLLAQNKNFGLCRAVALEYLIQHPEIRIQVGKPLIRSILTADLAEQALDFLQSQGTGRFGQGNELSGLCFLAAVWRYRPEEVWNWVEKEYLDREGVRADNFTRWVSAIEDIHVETRAHYHWPTWVKEEALLLMLPDFLALPSPERTGGVVTDAISMSFFRSDCLNKIAESGNLEVAKGLAVLIGTPDMAEHRDLLLNTLARCKKANVRNLWVPLTPPELLEFIEKDKRPVRNHRELFYLTLEIVNDVKNHIQSGDPDLKKLFWNDAVRKGGVPRARKEEILQIAFFEKIQTHPLRRKIFGAREPEITGGKKPDIMVACRNTQGEILKVFIEMKRQLHRDLFTAIQEQLADKYLIDPDADYGIYLVGWFGSRFYGVSRERIQKACGNVPSTAQTLESCLQKLCDQVLEKRHYIDAIRAVVVDLELSQ